ncbi:MAG: hypothetical protein LBQ57_08445 [Spirochaetales bacterium]|jgi:alanyl-tRNA synthetase|nr:hypothetical protein [Spirochaetales bacterium]
MRDTTKSGEFTAADENALWYRQPWTLEFDAAVREVRAAPGAGPRRLALTLDPCGFFPGGGGQPCDLGTVAGAPLAGVREEGGRILHFVDEADWKAVFPEPAAGQTVRCRVDSLRRSDFAQQHTGEHILAACLKTAINVEAVSVHFGEQYSTIETLAREISEDELARAEAAANAVLAGGRKVICHWIDAADMDRYPLRRAPDVRGRVHIVQIGEAGGVADVCACCGVHLPDTSALGHIIITGTEKIRGRVRLRFITGGRVIKAFHAMSSVLGRLRTSLSCADGDLPRAAEDLLAESRNAKRRLGEARGRLFRYEAAELASRSQEYSPAPGVRARFMQAFLGGCGGQELSGFTACCLQTGPAFVLVCDMDEKTPPDKQRGVSWIAAHNFGNGKETDLKVLLPPLLAASGGKGGGTPERFQGSFPGPAAYLEFAAAVRKRFS